MSADRVWSRGHPSLFATHVSFQNGHEVLERHGEVPIDGEGVLIRRHSDHPGQRPRRRGVVGEARNVCVVEA